MHEAKQLTCHAPTQETTVHRVRCQNKYQTHSFQTVPAYMDCEQRSHTWVQNFHQSATLDTLPLSCAKHLQSP